MGKRASPFTNTQVKLKNYVLYVYKQVQTKIMNTSSLSLLLKLYIKRASILITLSIYTANTKMPVSACKCWHRSVDR